MIRVKVQDVHGNHYDAGLWSPDDLDGLMGLCTKERWWIGEEDVHFPQVSSQMVADAGEVYFEIMVDGTDQ